jgi:hypothetical protein
MHFSYYIILLMASSVIVTLIRDAVVRRKNMPVDLFIEGSEKENSGQFEKALLDYESALSVSKKIRSPRNFTNKIIEKIKLLHMVMEDQRNSGALR